VKSPIYATGVGLLLFGKRQMLEGTTSVNMNQGLKGIFERMKSWFQGNF